MARLIGSILGFSLIFGAAGAGLIWWNTRGPDLVLMPPAASDAMVEAARSDAAGGVLLWWLLTVFAVAVAALIWLIWAQLSRPATSRDERGLTISWLLFLLIAIILVFALGVSVLANPQVAAAWRFGMALAVLVVAPLDFFLTTAVGVKNSMIPSVPLARLLRS